MDGLIAYILAQKYADDSMAGAGAVKGVPCQIQSITPIAGGNRVVFLWIDNNNVSHTQTLDVMDGATGAQGERGERGLTGAQGEQGIQGIQGIQGPKGDTGAQGAQGIQGIQGIQGPKGDDGYPFLIYKQYDDISEFNAADFPEIGLMFMVMTWETDPDTGDDLGYPIYRYTGSGTPPYSLVTHMNTQGIKGDKGDKGDTGAQGIQGEKGDKGDKGDTGAQGIQGVQGEQGVGMPTGGSTGQVPVKNSDADYDFNWKGTTDQVKPNSHDLVESGSVYGAINTALSSIYTPRGEITCAELTSSLLIEENIGSIYETSDSGTTTNLFLQGAGETIPTGANVGIINAGPGRILFNLMANAFDLTAYQKKDLTTPLTIGGNQQTTVEGALGALNTTETTDIQNVYKVNGVVGAKNALPITRPSRTTNTGVTFTVNSDGSVTVNGTASADTWFQLCDGFKLKDIGYTLTGCPSGGSSTTYELQFRSTEADSSQWQMVNDYGNGKTATGDPTRTYIGFVGIHSGYTATNLTFYPMIRLATDTDSTYQPYAMTNQQMTPYVQAISNPNLLDNPWFTVNQRGNTFYSTANKYCVDRWILGQGAFTARETNKPYGVLQTVTANSNGWIRQKTDFDLDTATPVTYSAIIDCQVTSNYGFSLKMSNMDDYTESQQEWFATTANTKVLVSMTKMPYKNTAFEVIANSGASATVKIYALKAELGTVSTLALDTTPNYASELLKCQRYFFKVSKDTVNTSSWVGIALANGNATCAFPAFPVTMRAKPTVSNTTAHSFDTKTAMTVTNVYADVYGIQGVVLTDSVAGRGYSIAFEASADL